MKVFFGVGVEILVFWFLWPTGIDKPIIWLAQQNYFEFKFYNSLICRLDSFFNLKDFNYHLEQIKVVPIKKS